MRSIQSQPFHTLICLILLASMQNSFAQSKLAGDLFDTKIAPFMKQHCVTCHGPRKHKANLMLHKMTGVMQTGDAQVWQAVLVQLEMGQMPPEERPRPDKQSLEQVTKWIHDQLAALERSPHARPPIEPHEGNHIDHDAIFSPKVESKPATPARIWRVRPSVYESFVEHVARQPFRRKYGPRGTLFSTPWGLAGDGIRDYAALYWIGEAETELLISNAMRVAQIMTQKRGRFSRESQVFQQFLRSRDESSPREIGQIIDAAFEQVLQREPSAAESKRYAAFMKTNLSKLGRELGLQTTLASLLLHPRAVFRFELGQGDPDEHGRVRLAPTELAYAIAYALTDEAPDELLLEAAMKGKLTNADQIRAQAMRILQADDIGKPTLLRFFQEYFGYTRAPQVFKDQATRRKARLGGNYSPDSLVEDTNLLVLHILNKDKQVLRELLTTNRSFMSSGSWMRFWQQSKDKLAARARREGRPGADTPFADKRNRTFEHYNFDPDRWTKNMPLQLDAAQRAGILTQPSWLIAHSTNFENHAIHRGKWVRERLLGGSIPDTPITVEAQLPDDDTLTLRQKMRVTRETFCWKCHQHMDPLGLPFEMYDHFGRHRESELDKPVDTSGAITQSGDDRLDGDVRDAVHLMQKLADSRRVQQVFVRHVFRYFLGRNETSADARTLIEADRAYTESDGSFKALVASLIASDSFTYRTPMKVGSKSRDSIDSTTTQGGSP